MRVGDLLRLRRRWSGSFPGWCGGGGWAGLREGEVLKLVRQIGRVSLGKPPLQDRRDCVRITTRCADLSGVREIISVTYGRQRIHLVLGERPEMVERRAR